MKKRLAALLSVLFMICSVLGCGTQIPAPAETKDENGSEAVTEDSVLKDGKMTVLKVVCPGGTSSPASEAEVEAAINAIIQEEMDAEIDFEYLEWGVFGDQQNLILSSGEDYALVFTYSNSKSAANQGQVLDITELAETYAPGALKEMEKVIDACKVNGRLYGMPTFHEYASKEGLVCLTSVLEELQINPEEVKTWDDVTEVLAKVHEAHPEMNVLCPADGNCILTSMAYQYAFDSLTEGVGVYAGGDDPLNVVNIFSTPEYLEIARRAYEWNQAGYIIADATTIPDTRQELLAAGNTFGFIGGIHPGTATQEAKNAGVDVTCITIDDAILVTNKCDFAQYMVPSACSAPEKAVKLLDLMYTNTDIINLIAYGIEGKDYEVKDAEKDLIGYPEGVDSSSVGWNNETWLVGNAVKGHVWETDRPEIWDEYSDLNNNSAPSCVFGFTFITENVKTEVAAVSNVIEKYRAIIGCGYAEPEAAIAEFNAELEAAGINTIIEEAKTQIQAWLDAK